ncbi:MAG: T9SS type A sorting domain-containing protein [Bacteroidota bacterium]|jgi:hypothetical protein
MNITKNKSRLISILALSLLCLNLSHAQVSFNSSGSDATGSGGNVTYSIGQVVYNTHSGINGSSAQGVQQAYEILTLYYNENAKLISLIAFPNPTNDNLVLEIGNNIVEELQYELFDLQGKLIKSEKIVDKKVLVDMINEPSSIYYINIYNQENKKVQSFKIIKN